MKSSLVWRYRTVQVLLGLACVLIVGQIIRIQSSPLAETFREKGELYNGEWRTIFPPRGEIYDRNGALLAGNVTVYEIGVDVTPGVVENPHTIALVLSVHLGLDYDEIYNLITQPPDGTSYVVVKDFVSKEQAEELMTLKGTIASEEEGHSLAGLHFMPHYMRYYPEGSLASNVIGFVSHEQRGYFGIEGKYNTILAGIPITTWVPLNPNLVKDWPEFEPGTTLILTIDRSIQAATEEILEDALDESGATTGTIIVMDPQTGEILAMATTRRMDLNAFWQYEDQYPGETPFNPAISQAYEPGSVMKIFTMAAALDAGKVVPTTQFIDYGELLFHGTSIRNWNNKTFGQLTMTTCLQHSSNVCLATVSTEYLGTDIYYNYMKAFGFGRLTNIDLAGERTGVMRLPIDDGWSIIDLATNAFGQGLSATPIQILTGASAIANGGEMVYPHLVHYKVINGESRLTTPIIANTPITEYTAQTLTEMLAISLEQEASTALVPGYRIAGKTGTAQIPTEFGWYDFNETNASFIGWGPIDDPQFMVYIWLERPKSSIWASVVAAPVFNQMVQRLVVLLEIPPDNIRHLAAGR